MEVETFLAFQIFLLVKRFIQYPDLTVACLHRRPLPPPPPLTSQLVPLMIPAPPLTFTCQNSKARDVDVSSPP
ncbi:hypothetical protein Bca4012_027556 [Brassica carinata]